MKTIAENKGKKYDSKGKRILTFTSLICQLDDVAQPD